MTKRKKKETTKELHKSKKLWNYRLLYSAGSNFKDSEVDIPKSMLIKRIYSSNFFKVFFRVQNVFTVSSEIISILSFSNLPSYQLSENVLERLLTKLPEV